jgi:phage baseplate assembly protein W|tara:strand:+ start:29 stop:577 length:549 start_codon:yes stop_codon:yes gene_type:complete
MARINLSILEKTDKKPDVSIFSDLNLNFRLGNTFNDELNKKDQITDIKISNNLDAIRNSFISLITTSPGEKILNPTFGINFGDLLFLPVSEPRALVIGENIVENIARFEPRIQIVGLEVIADEVEQEYIINFEFTIPRFNNQNFSIIGALNKTGFYESSKNKSSGKLSELSDSNSGSSAGGY